MRAEAIFRCGWRRWVGVDERLGELRATSPDGREVNLVRHEVFDPDARASRVVFVEAPALAAEHLDHPCGYRDDLIRARRDLVELVALLRASERQLDAMVLGVHEPVAVLGLGARLRAKLEALDAERNDAAEDRGEEVRRTGT